MRQFAAAVALLALSAARPAAARDAAFRGARRRVLLQAAASPPSGEFHANAFIFGGGIDVQSSCAVFTDLDDGGSDTLRTAVGDPRCTRVALAAGLTVALTRPLVITRSLRLECDYSAAVVASLVPPVPLSAAWDTLGGGAPRRDAIGAAGVADNATLAGALPGACALDGGGVSRLITVPRAAPSGLRVNITNIVLRNGFADGAGPQDGGGSIFIAALASLLVLDHVSFFNNSATNGGAILLANTSTLVALASRFVDNRAVRVGGAIAAFNAELALEKCWIERSVNGEGGTVAALQGTNVQVLFTVFVDNVGTALLIGPQATAGQAALVSFSRFIRNSAPAGDGGAILAFGARPTGGPRLTLRLVRCRFEGNIAFRFGGALATRGGVSTEAEHCEFAANADSCTAAAPLVGAVYINIGADAGGGCSDTLTVRDGSPDCRTWAADELAHQTSALSRLTAAATCVPLAPALLGPFCCSPSLAAPLGCPATPVVFDLPQLLCPAP